MKKILLILFLTLVTISPVAALDIWDTGWEFHLVDKNFFYPNYIADPFAPRFEANSRNLSINEVALDSDVRLDIVAGTRFSLFSFRPTDNPDVGVQVDLGMTIPMFMEGGSNDLLAMDGIYLIGLVISPVEWLDFRVSRHHICTHAGDEIDTNLTGDHSIEYDTTPNINSGLYVRDDFGISLAIEPLGLIGEEWLEDVLLIYGDYYFFWPGEDPLGLRQCKPARDAYRWFNVGAELKTPSFGEGLRLFAATNVSIWEELDWMPSYSFDFGVEIPGAFKGLNMKLSYNIYNGRSLMNSFYNRREVFTGITISIDS